MDITVKLDIDDLLTDAVKAKILDAYLDKCSERLETLTKLYLTDQEPSPEPEEIEAVSRPIYYKDNKPINHITDIPKGVQLVNGSYQVYWVSGGKKLHHSCHSNLTDAVVAAYELYSTLPGIEAKHYRSIIDWLEL